jgi:hypothetical protein
MHKQKTYRPDLPMHVLRHQLSHVERQARGRPARWEPAGLALKVVIISLEHAAMASAGA